MDDIADLVSKESDKKYFYDFRYIMGEFMAKEIGLMKQRKLENEATATSTFKLTTLLISLTMAIDFNFEWVIDNGIPNLIITIKTTMIPLSDGNKKIKIECQERSAEIDDIGQSGSSLQRRI